MKNVDKDEKYIGILYCNWHESTRNVIILKNCVMQYCCFQNFRMDERY